MKYAIVMFTSWDYTTVAPVPSNTRRSFSQGLAVSDVINLRCNFALKKKRQDEDIKTSMSNFCVNWELYLLCDLILNVASGGDKEGEREKAATNRKIGKKITLKHKRKCQISKFPNNGVDFQKGENMRWFFSTFERETREREKNQFAPFYQMKSLFLSAFSAN